MAAYAQQAKYDTRQTTAAARRAFDQRFLDQVDPDRVLPEAERARRVEAARRSYFAGISLKRDKTRKRLSPRAVAARQQLANELAEMGAGDGAAA